MEDNKILNELLNEFGILDEENIIKTKIANNITTPFIEACLHGEIITVKMLIDSSINDRTRYGFTPLMASCYNGHYEIAKLLIESGVKNINAITKNGWSALTMAVKRNDVKLAKLLLDNGANPNLKTFFSSALKMAQLDYLEEMTKLLEEYGAIDNEEEYD